MVRKGKGNGRGQEVYVCLMFSFTFFPAIACKVTHVETPNEFWVQFEEEISKLETLEKFIRKYCSDSKQEPFLEKGGCGHMVVINLLCCCNKNT